MTEVRFYDKVDDSLLNFAVILSRTNGKWVLCKHRDRNTFEVPGGHREQGEGILDTARRELREETGAIDFCLKTIGAYSVKEDAGAEKSTAEETYGMLFWAEILSFGKLENEIGKILVCEKLPDHWTYPLVYPELFQEAKRRGFL